MINLKRYVLKTKKNIHADMLERMFGNKFYKSYYIDNKEFRIYTNNNKFKLFVFHQKLGNWICIGRFNNPRLAKREIDYIVSGKKSEEVRAWFDNNKVEMITEF